MHCLLRPYWQETSVRKLIFYISNTFTSLLGNKLLVISAESHIMIFCIANMEDTDQTDPSEAVRSGYALFAKGLLAGNKCSKIYSSNTFLPGHKLLVIRSSLIYVCTVCLDVFWQATSVLNLIFRTLLFFCLEINCWLSGLKLTK